MQFAEAERSNKAGRAGRSVRRRAPRRLWPRSRSGNEFPPRALLREARALLAPVLIEYEIWNVRGGSGLVATSKKLPLGKVVEAARR